MFKIFKFNANYLNLKYLKILYLEIFFIMILSNSNIEYNYTLFLFYECELMVICEELVCLFLFQLQNFFIDYSKNEQNKLFARFERLNICIWSFCKYLYFQFMTSNSVYPCINIPVQILTHSTVPWRKFLITCA